MQKLYEKLLFLLLIIVLSAGHISAQNKLWPGDANNNGVTNCVDLLYIGVGYDESGPIRPNATTLWQEQDVDSLWVNDYADNTSNYAYGDCNGDGTIDSDDLEMAIKANYLLEHNSNSPSNNSDGFEASDASEPLLEITPDITTVIEGGEIKIDFNLGDVNLPLEDFYGIAMVISYDRPYVNLSAPVQFSAEMNAFTNPSNSEAVNTVFTDTQSQQIEFAYVRTDRQNAASGSGKVGTFSFIIDDDVIAPLAIDTIEIKVDSVRIIDKDLNPIKVNFAAASFNVEVLQSSRSSNPTNCPQVLDPVCGSNGVTYMNSCFAKTAGITEYTSGICYSECIEPADIDPIALADCSNNYIPVCGCNDVTYLNSCVADNSGVNEYTIGACVASDVCFDPELIKSSIGADIDRLTGVITQDCDDVYDAVCGCDGFTYQNSCIAEASGIAFYTQGSCNNVCIDPDAMNQNANCVNVYEPVCGCNDVTYTNACFAEAAGVVDYTNGACGSSGSSASNWCTNAQAIQCGDYLASETTIGESNNIESYYWNTSVTYKGADKVYVINKDQAGDLQIGLEIVTPGVNLDLFLLSGDCNNLTCIGASQSDNSTTNNEGIVFENAPIGTYYIVVDGLLPSYQGDYKLEVSCGDLDCNDPIALVCGQAITNNNQYGNDNVSAYSCGNILNVENNGNEVLHTFTLTETGQVDIYLTNLTANLELFLLSNCDRGDCYKFSSNPGTSDEHISTYLQPGTYQVVVDGYNGAISNYQLLVDCPSSCNIGVTASATGTNCGQSNGSFTVNSTGGTPGYIVSWTGPVGGSFSTNANTCTIYNLPSGTYEVTKTDANSCSETVTIEISDFGSHIEASLTVTDAVCNTKGAVNVSLTNGASPYLINVSGPISGTATSALNNFNINQLPSGDYTIFITDKFGCTVSKMFTVEKNNNNFTINGYTTPSQCESLGKIHISLGSGSPTYTIHVTGPVSGSATTNSSNFNIPNLPGGTYTVLIEDKNWCSDEVIFVIEEEDIDIDLVPTNGICGDNGALTVNISNGAPNYSISWAGPMNGNVTSSAPSFTIPNLPGGTYSVTVTDSNWCEDYQVATIDNTIANLDADINVTDATCGVGSVWIDINNGSAPYTISYSGPQNGSGTTTTNGFDISNLTTGTYTITIMDMGSCSYTEVIEVGTDDSSVSVNAWPNDGSCGALGNIEVTVTNGTSPYTITYGGPSSNTVMSNSPIFIIDDLISGDYNIEVTDENGCMDWTTAMVNNSGSGLVISTSPWNGTCGTPGEITVDIQGGAPTYNIAWDGPSSGAATSSNNSYTINNALSGSYGVTVSDSEGCTDETIQIINNDANDLDIVVDPINGQCGNPGNIGLAISGAAGPYSVMWSGEESGLGTTSSDFGIGNLAPGSYTITIVSNDGCSKTTQVEIINVGDPITVSTSASANVCGSGGAINVIYDTPSATITWTGPSSGSANSTNGNFVIDDASTGLYNILVSNGNGCDAQVGVEVIEVENEFDFTVTTLNGECQTNGAATITFDPSTFEIVWSGPVNGNVVDNTGTYEIQNLPAGLYTISLIDNAGCKKTKEFTITIDQTVVNVHAVGVNGVCDLNGSIDVSFGTGSGLVSWSGPSTGSGSSSATNGSFTIPNLESGTYGITVEDANACTGSTTIEIINATQDVSITAEATNAICNSNGAISVTTDMDVVSVGYTGPISGTATPVNGGLNINGTPAGTYTLIATNSNGCSAEIVVEVTTSINTLSLAASSVNGVCGQNGSLALNFSPGDVILDWSGPVSGSAMSVTGAFDILDLPSGTYTITATDIEGCTESITTTVANTTSSLVVTPSITNVQCSVLGSATLSFINGIAPYTITQTGAAAGTYTSTINSLVVDNLVAGSYQFIVADDEGCAQTIDIVIAADQSNLTVSANVQNDVCGSNGAVTLNLNGGTADYTIDIVGPTASVNNSTQNSITLDGLSSGSYTANVVDADGCSTNTSFVINNSTNTNLSISATAVNGSCGQSPGILVNISGGAPVYTLTWNGPEIGSTTTNNNSVNINDLTPGTYDITVVDSNGCSHFTAVNITGSHGSFDATIAVTNAYCNVLGSIWITTNSGVAPYLIEWTGTQTGSYTSSNIINDISNLPAGTYTASITDANGCKVSSTLTVVDNGIPTQFIATTTQPSNTNDGAILVEVLTNNPDHTVSWTGPTNGTVTINGQFYNITGLVEGTYAVTVKDNAGCSSTQNFVLTNSSTGTGTGSGGGTFSANVNPTDMVCGNPGNLFITMSSGAVPYTITWSGTSSGTDVTSNSIYSITNLEMGSYSVIVTDALGNSESSSVSIGGSGAFDITTSTNDGSCGNDDGSISIVVNSGVANYTIFWNGPVSNNAVFTNDAITIDDLPSGTYDITVSDANDCPQIFTTTVNNIDGAPAASFSSTSDVLTASFTNGASSGLYTWDFGDGNTSNATNPTHEFCDPGTYNVCLTVTNTCGSNMVCSDVVVSIPSDVVILDIQDGTGGSGSNISIPVTIANCETIVSLAGSIEVDDNTVCVVNGLSPGVIDPNYFSDNGTFSYVNNNGNGISTNDEDVLFYIDVTLTGEEDEFTQIHITDNPLQVEVGSLVNGLATALPSVELKGIVNISSSAIISGSVKTYWGEGIENTEITISSDNMQNTQMTDVDGYYMEPDLPMGEMYAVAPNRDFNDQNGLSSYALFVGQRFILGMDPIEIVSPYQVIAGDANCSNSFTTIDLFILQQLIIGTTEGLDFCPSWTFVKESDQMPTDFDAYNVFPYNNTDELMVLSDQVSNFVGVKVGDILGHANPSNLTEDELSKSEGVLDVYVNDVSVEKDETFELTFSSNNFNDIVSYQLGLAFDAANLEFVESIKSDHTALAGAAIGETNAEAGRLRASWFSLDGEGLSINEEEKLFTLTFKALSDINNILDYVSFDNKNILTEAHNISLEKLDVVLNVGDEISTALGDPIDLEANFGMGQNTPNPFTKTTQIEFTLPKSMEASVSITNVLGETVKVISREFSQGNNIITLSQSELGSGVFHYTLIAGDRNITRTMISLK